MAEPTTAVGVFESRSQAEQALDELQRAGFRWDQVGFALRGDAHPADPTAPGGSTADEAATPGATNLADAATSHHAVGIIPGLGPVTTGGPLTGILGGAAAGALAGGLLGALVGLGVLEAEARRCAQAFRAGRPLVLVKANGRVSEAVDLLRRHGATDHRDVNEPTRVAEAHRAGLPGERDAESRG
jgi:hypothetical protein